MSFNHAQSQAIAHKDGPCMVLAGPGSGKTTVITNRIRHLIEEEQVSPEEILVITFSKAAAKEMRERFFALPGMQGQRVTFGTFHGIYYGILKWAYRLNRSNILSEEEKYQLLKEVTHRISKDMDEDRECLQTISEEIGKVKNSCCELESFHAQSCDGELFQKVYDEYERVRKIRRKLDFDDMLVMTKELFVQRPDILKRWQERYRYILIDEFQDINQVQYDVVRMLALPENNLFIVGDDDQSIYQFRGARPEIMLHFPCDYPGTKEIVLDVNYRSTSTIVEAAQNLVRHNKNRYEKNMDSYHGQGMPIEVREFADGIQESRYVLEQIREAMRQGVHPSQIAVIFRTNMEARTLVETATEYNLPFQMKEYLPSLYEHFICRDFITYMEMAFGDRSRGKYLQIMNRPNRYIGRESIETKEVSFEQLRIFYEDKEWMLDRIDEWELDLLTLRKMAPYSAIQYIRKKIGYDDFILQYAKERNISMEDLTEVISEIEETAKQYKTNEEWLEHIERCEEIEKEHKNRMTQAQTDGSDRISFLTMHGAKGLEFDLVFIIGVNEKITPYKKAKLDAELEEERRMFYVAITRARKRLLITHTKIKNGKEMSPSRFLNELFLVV